MDKRRISSTPSATGDIAHDEPRQRAGSPSAATATADGDYVHRSNGSHALPFADAGLKGAGHIFLTKYGRGRSTSDVSKSPSKHSPGGHQTFYVVRARRLIHNDHVPPLRELRSDASSPTARCTGYSWSRHVRDYLVQQHDYSAQEQLGQAHARLPLSDEPLPRPAPEIHDRRPAAPRAGQQPASRRAELCAGHSRGLQTRQQLEPDASPQRRAMKQSRVSGAVPTDPTATGPDSCTRMLSTPKRTDLEEGCKSKTDFLTSRTCWTARFLFFCPTFVRRKAVGVASYRLRVSAPRAWASA